MDLKVRFGFLNHPSAGSVLIDTGYCPRVTSGSGRSFVLRVYAGVLGPKLSVDCWVLPFLRAQNKAPQDIRHIIITHFHADHISALNDFPNARFIVSRHVWESFSKSGAFNNLRHGIFSELVPADFASRMIFFEDMPEVKIDDPLGHGFDLFGDQSVLGIPLPGHAAGHCGILFQTTNRPLLYATDVQWLPQAITDGRAPGRPASWVYDDSSAAGKSAKVVRDFAANGGDFLLCHQSLGHEYDSRGPL